MRLTKLAMLTATAAVMASAFIGASTASATITHPWVDLCKTETLLLCTTANLTKHPLLGKMLFSLFGFVWNSGFVTIKCSSGMGQSNEVESQQEKALKFTLEGLTTSGCSGCTNATFVTPQSMEINMATEGGNDWRLKSSNTKFRFSGCPFGVECEYEGTLNLAVQADAEGSFTNPEGTSFNLIKGGGLCAAVGKWESGLTRLLWTLDNFTTHKKVWLTLLEKLAVAS